MKGFLKVIIASVFFTTIAAERASAQTRPDHLVQLFTKKKFKKFLSYANTEVTQHINTENLKDIWTEFIEDKGKYKSWRFIKQSKVEEESKTSMVYRYRLFFEKDSVSFDLTIAYNKIYGFFFRPGKDMLVYKSPPYADNRSYYFRSLKTAHPQFPLDIELIYPKFDSSKKIPLVILVHGSGPADKDESIGPNKPFLDLAYALANEGIAVMRYEKRTKTYGNQLKDAQLTLFEEVIDDTKWVMQQALSLHFIDSQNIYFAGHSLGAAVLHKIIDYNSQSAGGIMLCGTFAPLNELIAYQLVYLDTVGKRSKPSKKVLETSQKFSQLYDAKNWSKMDSAERKYWNSLRNLNQQVEWGQLRQPLLIINGKQDYQVPPSFYSDLASFAQLRPNTTFKEFESINHLLIEASGLNNPSQYESRGNVKIEVPKLMAEWIFSIR